LGDLRRLCVGLSAVRISCSPTHCEFHTPKARVLTKVDLSTDGEEDGFDRLSYPLFSFLKLILITFNGVARGECIQMMSYSDSSSVSVSVATPSSWQASRWYLNTSRVVMS
jgi:hypothetical protein